MSVLPKKILLSTDGSEDAVLATRAAVDIANGAGAELHLVHAWSPVPSTRFEQFIRTEMHREAQRLVQDQAEQLKSLGGTVASTHLKEGPLVEEILETCAEVGADLLVMGTRGQGPVARLLLGSVVEGVVFGATSPVLVVRGGDAAWPPRRVICADDSSESARLAAELAIGIGSLFDTRNLIMRVYPRLPSVDEEGRQMDSRRVDDELRREEQALEERAAQFGTAGDRPKVCIAVGNPAKVIMQEAGDEPEQCLISVGKRGLSAIGRMRLGSTSTKILRVARGPVLIYPHQDV